jgi:hypothetical protein
MIKDQVKDESLKTDEDLANLDNLEIQPLSDEDLDAVAGGLCSLWSCSNAAVKQQ